MLASIYETSSPRSTRPLYLSHVTPLGCSISARISMTVTCHGTLAYMDTVLEEAEFAFHRKMTHPATYLDFLDDLCSLDTFGTDSESSRTRSAALLVRGGFRSLRTSIQSEAYRLIHQPNEMCLLTTEASYQRPYRRQLRIGEAGYRQYGIQTRCDTKKLDLRLSIHTLERSFPRFMEEYFMIQRAGDGSLVNA